MLPEASFHLLVLLVPASVCLSVHVSVCVYQSQACPHDNSPLLQARITKFRVKMQKTLVLRSLLFWGLIDPELQGQIQHEN